MTRNPPKIAGPLPGGGSQGTVLGCIIFIVKFNGAFMRPAIPRPINCKSIAVKYVDDGTAAIRIKLKESLVNDPILRQKPLTYHEKDELILPADINPAQMFLEEANKFAKENHMIINESKTKVMVFNMTKNLQFPPEIKSADQTDFIKVVPSAKVLGVTVSNDLKWWNNTNTIVEKARKRILILRRLKKLQFDSEFLFEIYTKEIRPLLEFAAPVWSSSIKLTY